MRRKITAGFEQLFTVDFTLGMLRDKIKRLSRKSWCKTKRLEVLADILAIYIYHHNTYTVLNPSKNQS